MEIKEAIQKLREEKERKFNQTVELIINLKGIDAKRDNVNTVITIPHRVKEKKICAFLSEKSKIVDTIRDIEFDKYKNKNELRKLIKKYDFFIAEAPLMPKVAATFGKALGPAGKMPSPQLGIIPPSNENALKSTIDKIAKSIKIRMKEPSFKIVIGKSDFEDEKIEQNAREVFKKIISVLPKKNENLKDTMIKFTMTKPIKIVL